MQQFKFYLVIFTALLGTQGVAATDSFSMSCNFKVTDTQPSWALDWDLTVVSKEVKSVRYQLDKTQSRNDGELFDSRNKDGWNENDFVINVNSNEDIFTITVPKAKEQNVNVADTSVVKGPVTFELPSSLLAMNVPDQKDFEVAVKASSHTAFPIGTLLSCKYQTRKLTTGGNVGTSAYTATKDFIAKLNLPSEKLGEAQIPGVDLESSFVKRLSLNSGFPLKFICTSTSTTLVPDVRVAEEPIEASERCDFEVANSLSRFEWSKNEEGFFEKVSFIFNFNEKDSKILEAAFEKLYRVYPSERPGIDIRVVKIPMNGSITGSILGGDLFIECQPGKCKLYSKPIDFTPKL